MANSNHQNNESEEIRDTIVEVLTSINHRPSITETIIGPETQNNDRMDSFLVNIPPQQGRTMMNYNYKKRQNKCINYKEKINSTTRRSDMKKVR